MKNLQGDGWRLRIPDGLISKPHKAWGYDHGSMARGWIGEAPVTLVVQVKRLETGFNEHVKALVSYWLEHDPPRRIRIRGAADAVRLDGIIEFDGLGAKDDRERVAVIAAKAHGDATSLTVRTRPEDGIDAEVEAILASFELVQP